MPMTNVSAPLYNIKGLHSETFGFCAPVKEMSTHKAIAAIAKGHVDEIQVSTAIPGEDQVLIKVVYASMAAFDAYVADRGYFVDSFPSILGAACAGTVEKLGSGVTDLHVGDRVKFTKSMVFSETILIR